MGGLKNGLGGNPNAFLRARNFDIQDKFGNTQKLRVQTSNSGSSNYKAKSIQFDRADYGALINLANKARKVKSYSYYNVAGFNNDQVNITGQALINKASGVP